MYHVYGHDTLSFLEWSKAKVVGDRQLALLLSLAQDPDVVLAGASSYPVHESWGARCYVASPPSFVHGTRWLDTMVPPWLRMVTIATQYQTL